MNADLEQLYVLLAVLRDKAGQGGRLSEYRGRGPWPRRGVYFFFEPGEYRTAGQDTPRVVRVGTHAVSLGSKSSLWGRLRAHRGTRSGGGNHRGSVFRRHVGQALLSQAQRRHATWGIDSIADRTTRDAERELESQVSAYIGAMTLLWINVPDEPGPSSLRAIIERNAIALLSNRCRPADSPSANWLGRCSPTEEIKRSGLWNVDHIARQFDQGSLKLIEQAVHDT